nr:hypothetical protein [uncultured Kingella sp.]
MPDTFAKPQIWAQFKAMAAQNAQILLRHFQTLEGGILQRFLLMFAATGLSGCLKGVF